MTLQHEVVSQEEWLESQRDLLASEKELTRLRDAVSQKRLALPWVEVEKEYVFASVDGPQTLADLFDGRSQLLVQHFMFPSGWRQGCKSCSFMTDHTDGINKHLTNHDVAMVAVYPGQPSPRSRHVPRPRTRARNSSVVSPGSRSISLALFGLAGTFAA